MRCREKEITYINIYLIQRDYTSTVYLLTTRHTPQYRRGDETAPIHLNLKH